VTYPLDVVRRRMQMKGLNKSDFSYKSTFHAFTTILQKEGIKGLYKGILPNLIKVSRIESIIILTQFIVLSIYGFPFIH